jgi:SAM-dependent methyltransferase
MMTVSYHDLYDSLYRDKAYEAEAKVIRGFLGTNARSLLDVGCGTGRYARAFAELGLAVVGIDIDPAMIAVARRRTPPGAAAPRFLEGGVGSAPAGPFDAAVSLFNVVNYALERAALIGFFRGISERLAEGGRLVFDCWNGVAALRDPATVKRTEFDGGGYRGVVVTSPDTDAWRQVTTLDVEIYARSDDGAAHRVHYRFEHRLWTPQDILDALTVSALEPVRTVAWSDPRRDAAATDWKLLFIAERR